MPEYPPSASGYASVPPWHECATFRVVREWSDTPIKKAPHVTLALQVERDSSRRNGVRKESAATRADLRMNPAAHLRAET